MTAITFDKVWKEYGDHVVLERINIEIAPRSFVALVGPSGCGKTTFLRMLLGEEAATRGKILVGGLPLKVEPDADRGVVFQRYSVFPHLTVLQNVMIGREFEKSRFLGKLFGTKRKDAEVEARKLLEAVGLTGHENKYPSSLSGGMQQRLALAQALNRKPKILLLDEPFGALDPGIRADIHVLIRKIWNENDLTVVMVTHDLSEAFRLGTRVIAFERPRNRPEELERYGATLGGEVPGEVARPSGQQPGASITRDFDVWPKKIATALNGAAHTAEVPLDLTKTQAGDSKAAH
jgi:NitT/TauT family transport system ATP-binding protein